MLGSISYVHVRLCRMRACVQGLLSDPNIDPEYLGKLVMVGVNKSKFKPSIQMVKERYYEKFRGKGGGEPEDVDVQTSLGL